MFQHAAWGWVFRRLLDFGGIIATAVSFGFGVYAALPASSQDAVRTVLTGRWEDVTLGAFLPAVVAVVGAVVSYRATVKPQAVTRDGTKVKLDDLSASTRARVEIDAKEAPKRTFNPFQWFLR